MVSASGLTLIQLPMDQLTQLRNRAAIKLYVHQMYMTMYIYIYIYIIISVCASSQIKQLQKS